MSQQHQVDRRSFLKTVGAASLAGVVTPSMLAPRLFAGETKPEAAMTAVGEFYKTLSDEQKKAICFPFKHELKERISANWHVTKPEINGYTDAQQALIKEILKGITSEEGYKRLQDQMMEDSGGMGFYSVAIFGEPGSEACQWEMTGRHMTLRADGNRQDKVAFGGPTIYGHGEEEPEQNVFYPQTKKVNEVFAALDAKQAEKALLSRAPRETDIKIQGEKGAFPGLAVSDLSGDQKALVEDTLKFLLAPFQPDDVTEVMDILKASGGLDKLHFAFYQNGDLKSDKVWDIWRVEGPSLVWHFRGAPHVHAYINIALPNQA